MQTDLNDGAWENPGDNGYSHYTDHDDVIYIHIYIFLYRWLDNCTHICLNLANVVLYYMLILIQLWNNFK